MAKRRIEPGFCDGAFSSQLGPAGVSTNQRRKKFKFECFIISLLAPFQLLATIRYPLTMAEISVAHSSR
jgi:hypothetical protein